MTHKKDDMLILVNVFLLSCGCLCFMPFPRSILGGISWSYSCVYYILLIVGIIKQFSPSATDITHYPAGTCRHIDVNMTSLHRIDVNTTFFDVGKPVFKSMMLTSELFVNLLKIVFHSTSNCLIQSTGQHKQIACHYFFH